MNKFQRDELLYLFVLGVAGPYHIEQKVLPYLLYPMLATSILLCILLMIPTLSS